MHKKAEQQKQPKPELKWLYAVTAFFAIVMLLFIAANVYDTLKLKMPPTQISTSGKILELNKSSVENLTAEPNETEKKTKVKDYEAIYNTYAAKINKEHNFGLFETKLLKVGYYSYLENGVEKYAFRADIWVRNAGTGTETFHSENGYIRLKDFPNKTYAVTGGTFYGYNIVPNETRDGYLLFWDVPLNLNGNLTFVIGTAASYNTIFNNIMQFPFTYEIELK